MKIRVVFAIVKILGVSMAGSETRIFTNQEGKTIEAELISVEENMAVLRLVDGKPGKAPIDKLSKADQDFITAWWEENKDKVKPTDIRLTLTEKATVLRRQRYRKPVGDEGNEDKGTSFTRDVYYLGELTNKSSKDLRDVSVKYIIYKSSKFTSKSRGDKTTIDKVEGTCGIALLKVTGTESFQTVPVTTRNSKYLTADGMDGDKTEEILGISVTLSSGGKDFLTVEEPADLHDLLKLPEK
jgi:hypothetical protein